MGFVPVSLHVVGRNRMAQYFRTVSKKTHQKEICSETCGSLPFNYYAHFQQWQPLRRRFSPLGVVSAPRGHPLPVPPQGTAVSPSWPEDTHLQWGPLGSPLLALHKTPKGRKERSCKSLHPSQSAQLPKASQNITFARA